MNASTATADTPLRQACRELHAASGQLALRGLDILFQVCPRSLRAPPARLAWRPSGFVTNHHEQCGLAGRSHLFGPTGAVTDWY